MGHPEEDRTQADPSALERATDLFNDYAKRFENSLDPLGTCHDNVTTGAGEFASHLSTGNAKFLLGWRETFQACSETTGIMAGNIGNYALDLQDVDVDQTITVTI